MKSLIKDREGQAGGIITLMMIVAVFSFAYIVLSVVMDQLIVQSNILMTMFPFTQEHHDATTLINKYWYALPFIVILSLIIFVIGNAIRARTGEI